MNNRILDLNMDLPLLQVTMRDEARTTFEVMLPDEELINRLQNMGSDLDKLKTGDQAGVLACYALVAELMSYNTDGVKITAEDLRGKYGMRLVPMILFVKSYLDFVNEITNLKN